MCCLLQEQQAKKKQEVKKRFSPGRLGYMGVKAGLRHKELLGVRERSHRLILNERLHGSSYGCDLYLDTFSIEGVPKLFHTTAT